MNTFKLDTIIHYGENALNRLALLSYKKVLIITDPFIANGSMLELVTKHLTEGGIEYEVFCDVVPDAALADACTATNPRKPTKEEVMSIYRNMW